MPMPIVAKSQKGECLRAALSNPLVIQVGDKVQSVGNQVIVTRGGVVVGTATISDTPESVPEQAEAAATISSVIYFRSYPVAGQSVVLTRVTENQATSVVTFFYSNGVAKEYPSWADVGTQLGVMDQQSDLAENILAYKSFVNSPDGTNKTTMVDVNCAVNFEAGTPIALIEN